MKRWIDLIFTLALLTQLILTSLWLFAPATRPEGLTTDGRNICYLIVLVGFAMYIKMGEQEQ